MNYYRRPALLAVTALILSQVVWADDQPAGKQTNSVAGHWEGAIDLPNVQLEIRIDLESAGEGWQGSIDIPVQGLRGFKLGNLQTKGDTVTFEMPNLPGDPKFRGKLSDDGTVIEGEFSQAENSLPFKVTRQAKLEREGDTPSRGVPGEGLVGAWQGSLSIQLFQLRLLFKFKQDEGELSGTMDSIDQNAKDIPVSSVKLDGQDVVIKVASLGASFEGQLSADGSEVKGTFEQAGQSLPLVIKRLAKVPDLSRPQEPKPPYPYRSEEVTFDNPLADIQLAGTLTIPKSGGPHPAVVMITGSGPQDRDESIMGHRPFLVIADHLTRHGIAVLRYDDRGVGKSTGSFSKATTADFATDVAAAVEYLRRRAEIDSTNIGLVGHSEGGVIAPIVAAQSDDLRFLVLLAGVGVPMEQLLERQAADLMRVVGADDEAIKKNQKAQQELFQVVRENDNAEQLRAGLKAVFDRMLSELSEDDRKAAGMTDKHSESQVRMMESPWFKHFLEIDPRPTLAKVRCPVLALCGDKDLQVAAKENLTAIEQALRKGGNDAVTTVEFPGLNHLFQSAKTGAPAEYGSIEETFDPKVLELVSDWILKTIDSDNQ